MQVITTAPVASCKGIQQKMAMGQAIQDPDLPCSASNVLGKVSPLFYRVAGQVEMPAGQVNLKGSLPCSENNILQPMVHPGVESLKTESIFQDICRSTNHLHLK